MASLVPRSATYVCRACRSKRIYVPLSRKITQTPDTSLANQQFRKEQRRNVSSRFSASRSTRPQSAQPKITKESNSSTPRDAQNAQRPSATASDVLIDPKNVRGTLRDIQRQVNAICASQDLPEEMAVLEVMNRAYQFANLLVFSQTTAPDEEAAGLEEEERFSDKDLLSELDEPYDANQKSASSSSPKIAIPTSHREQSGQALSESIYTLLKDPKVLISEPVLSTYTRIMCQLGNPEYLPEIFFLYANKPQPVLNTSHPIQYRNPSPNSPKNAVPQRLSDAALDAAILQRDLALAVAIIDTTVGTRAFRLNKFVKRATLPLALVGSTPVAAYAAADWVAQWQNSLDPQMAKAITLMGSAAYIGTLSTIGFVAVATWNDHHERVRWTEGTPLRYRWMREEERLYFDRIAMAWGFQRKRRRGEEMGRLWEELREECGVRGMVLDKSELLPGMQ